MEEKTLKPESLKTAAPITELQKLKLIFDVVKWLIGSVALVIVTMTIDYGFRDRAAGLNEAKQYDHYVTELIVLNKEVGPRRLLAQYFSYVLPSPTLRKCWQDYYWVVNSEYRAMVKQDSVLGLKLKSYLTMKSVTPQDQFEFEALAKQKKYTEKELYGEFRLPTAKN
ncbi:MAG: hypothetical protein NTU51_00315 [Bacteroidetes bacterium]|nr:hypothetical protein [Bacteroidota bacterium]